MRGVQVPPELFAKVSPRRSVPGSARPMREVDAKRALAKIATAFARSGYGYDYAKIFRAGLKRLEGPAKETSKTALELARAPTIERIREADLDVLAVADHMVLSVDQLALLPCVAAARGVEDALEVAVRAMRLEPTADEGGWVTAIWIVAAEREPRRPLGLQHFTPLRHAICGADDATYARLVRSAEAHRSRFSASDAHGLRCRACLAYAFPDEPWANEDLCAGQAMPSAPWPNGPPELAALLSSATDLDVIRAELASGGDELLARYALDLAHVLPERDLLPILADALPTLLKKKPGQTLMKTPPRDLVAVIACYTSDAATAILHAQAKHPVLAPQIAMLLRTRANAPPPPVAASSAPVPPSGSMPSILRDRPWRAAKKKSARVDELAVPAMLGLDEAFVDGPVDDAEGLENVRDMTAAELSAWRAKTEAGLASNKYACADYDLLKKGNTFWHLRVPSEEAIGMYVRGASLRGSAQRMIALHGLAVTPALVGRDWYKWLAWYGGSADEFRGALKLATPALAPRMARVAARRKGSRREALAWIERHPRIAALGLVPDAVGPRGEARTDAEAALRHLVGRGHGAVIQSVGARYGGEVARVVDALVTKDPLALDATAPKPPPFLDLERLPEIRLATGERLERSASAALAEMLQVAPLDPPYAGVERVREACDPASLVAFANGLLDQWALADAPGRHVWMLHAVVHFSSADGERRVARLAREWARSSADKAIRACGALAAIATDAALMHLAHIAETTRFEALKTEAKHLLEEAAAARGLTVDELGDRTVPDLGLAPDGTMRFVFDGLTLVARLDEFLVPTLFDEAGAPQKSFPRASKSDSAERVAARERWGELRKDLEAIADRQLRRLERAMRRGRAWTTEDFRGVVLGRPLVAHVARRLVWSADGTLFRVAEDGSFADLEDRVFEPAPGATIRIGHPAREKALPAWSTVLADYEILQPFEQVGRKVFAIRDDEREAVELARCGGAKIAARKILGTLESRGWRRSSPGYVDVYVMDARRTDGTLVEVSVPLSPGIEMDLLDSATTVGAPTVAGGLSFGQIDAVSFSELVRDLEALRGAS